MDSLKGDPNKVKEFLITTMQSNPLLFKYLETNRPPEIEKVLEEYVALHGKLDFSMEQLDAIILQIINGDCYDRMLVNVVSEEALLNYLTSKAEENEQDSFILDNVIGLLPLKALQNLGLDQFRLAELLIRSTNISFTKVLSCYDLIQDNYLRALITISKQQETSDYSLFWYQEYISRIDSINTLSTEEEIRDYIKSWELQIDDDESNKYSYNNSCLDLMKKHLLSQISDHDDKMEIIRNIKPTVSPELQEYVRVAQDMLRDFLTSRGPLSPEEEERLELIFNSFSVYAEDKTFFDSNTLFDVNEVQQIGLCDYNRQTISILQSELSNTESTIMILLHEYVHALSNRNYNESVDTFGYDFEEGIADTVAELAFNGYMSKHNSVTINGQQCDYTDYVVSNSNYYEQNAQVKSILFAMESEGIDIDALIEVCIGDKGKFLDMAFGEKEADKLRKKFENKVMDLRFYPEQICQLLGSKILRRKMQKMHRNSPYLKGFLPIDLLTHILENGDTNLYGWLDEPQPLPRSAKRQHGHSLAEIAGAVNKHKKERR